MTKTIIVHPEFGVFLGHAMGLAFFSCMGDAGKQYEAAVFDDEAQARDFLSTWSSELDLNSFALYSMPTGFETGDSLCLKMAGVPDRMLETILRNEAEHRKIRLAAKQISKPN